MPFVSLIPSKLDCRYFLSSSLLLSSLLSRGASTSKSTGGAERLETGPEMSERGRDVWCVSAAKPLSPLQECDQRPAVGTYWIFKRFQLPDYCNNILHRFLCCHDGCGYYCPHKNRKDHISAVLTMLLFSLRKGQKKIALFFPNVICLNRIVSVHSAPSCFSPLLIPYFPVLCPRWHTCYSTHRCVCSAHRFPVLKLTFATLFLSIFFSCVFLGWEFPFLILTPVWPLTHDLCTFGGGIELTDLPCFVGFNYTILELSNNCGASADVCFCQPDQMSRAQTENFTGTNKLMLRYMTN